MKGNWEKEGEMDIDDRSNPDFWLIWEDGMLTCLSSPEHGVLTL